MTSGPIWTPTPARVAATAMDAFRRFCGERHGRVFEDVPALHRWSVGEPSSFWSDLWDFADIRGEKGGVIIEPTETMRQTRFFPEARLNFAENLLARDGDDDAIVFRCEGGPSQRVSWRELRGRVSRMQQALLAEGIEAGDRVAALLPNMPDAVVLMLAATSIGAIWTSTSPDFGVGGAVDRFGQIRPKVLFACDGYRYGGKIFDISDKVAEIARNLPSAGRVVVVPFLGLGADDVARIPRALGLADFLAPFENRPLRFARLDFDHPVYILFSSGTTGIPKCIVHRAGVLLQHVKEHRLHCDIRARDRVFYFSTLSWMMWNWLVSALASGATLALYDGSPMHPGDEVLLDYAEEENFTLFGTSAKYLDALRKAGIRPNATRRFDMLRSVCSTGSPLMDDSYDFVYVGFKQDVHLASISGGTDIVGAFVCGDPTRPVWPGEIQGPALGMAVEVWDENGRPAEVGVKGELVCVKPFPSMPVGFWNDPAGEKYRSAYFDRFGDVWHHGDYAERTRHGGYVIHGRSDATLNPGGVRIGTSEIYAQVEKIEEVVEAMAVGQAWDHDVRVILFVRLQPGLALDDALQARIRSAIRTGASPRHVPALIVAVPDMPRTRSGKITELAVRDVIHGRAIGNREALANPEALEHFCNLPQLADARAAPPEKTGRSNGIREVAQEN